jgi:putative ABC transport system permease protein
MTMVSNVDQILLAMAAAVILSSAVAILLALYNSMEQRRRQIAILRVLGASQLRIFAMIITEATIIGLLGCIVGLALSLGGASLVASTMHHRLGLYISPAVPPRETILLLLATLALAALAGLIPATIAYRTSVARNLRPIA